MASKEIVVNLMEAEKQFLGIDKEKLLRTNLGMESLSPQLEPIFEELKVKFEYFHKYAPSVHDDSLNHVVSTLSALNRLFSDQGNRNNQEYIAQKQNFISSCQKSMQQLKLHWPAFITAAVEERGLLHDEGIEQKYRETVASLREESEQTIQRIKSEATEAIESAKKLAEEIEVKARRTAAKISVKEAQDQFKSASRPLIALAAFWGVVSLFAIAAFFIILRKYLAIPVPEQWTWQVLYYSSIRLAALGAVGTIAAFSMRIFKSCMHMYLHNLHRLRLTNSMEAFVESAVTPEQRDLILAQLVEAIASFGNSGLLDDGGSNDLGARMTIDNITRTFSDSTRKGS